MRLLFRLGTKFGSESCKRNDMSKPESITAIVEKYMAHAEVRSVFLAVFFPLPLILDQMMKDKILPRSPDMAMVTPSGPLVIS